MLASTSGVGDPLNALQTTETLVILLTITLVVSLAARWLRLPYTLVLVLVGLGLGFSPLVNGVILNPDLVLFLFLPALLFEGAWNTSIKRLVADWLPVFLLAVPGLLIALAVLTVVLRLGVNLSWPEAALLAAIISPTDPIAALALFKRLGLAERLCSIIEGESLFNDGVGAAIFTLILQLLLYSFNFTPAASQNISPGLLVGESLWLLVGGPLLGFSLGWLGSRFLHLVDDHLFEMMLTLGVAYASYLCGTLLRTSGLLTVVCAGLVMGSYGKSQGMSQRSQEASEDVWEFIGYLANSLLFLLLGMQIGTTNLLQNLPAILWSVLGVLVGRALIVYTLIPLHDLLARRLARQPIDEPLIPRPRPLPGSWRPVLALTGLRGALSLALVLSLPAQFPQHALLVGIVYGVVLITLLGQGLALRFVLPHWPIAPDNENQDKAG